MKRSLILLFALFFIRLISYGQSNTDALITADELLRNFKSYTIIDISKKSDYEKRSILGAKNLWRSQITKNQHQYGGLMRSKEGIEQLLSELGIEPDDKIAVYDHKGGCDAARLWWILKHYGHLNVNILDGGLNTWKDKNALVDSVFAHKSKSSYQFVSLPKPHTIHLVDIAEIKAALSDPNTIIIDTRSTDEYEGLVQKDGAFKKGRIPGAIHLDWASNIDYNGNQLILARESLLNLYESNGVTKDKNIIVYCHSGVRSSHSAFVLTQLLGYKNVGNYDGSWVEWSYHIDLPIETGTYIDAGTKTETSYFTVLSINIKNGISYIWNEITFNVNPWYINYFWFAVSFSLALWGLEIYLLNKKTSRD